uniref:Cadherin domain-containing protein n=1 Tax=Amphiprion ocellaris TaxID=80972 RepID=A0AAQ6A4E3_AMPOC
VNEKTASFPTLQRIKSLVLLLCCSLGNTLRVIFALHGGLAFLFLVLLPVSGDVSYSIPEEMKRGSVIGNIATDLGLDMARLTARKARIDTEDNNVKYCSVNLNTGELVVQERIDREGLCAKKASCVVKQELRSGTVVIHVIVLDANDNVPVFTETVYKASLPENSPLDTVVLTVSATDADEGVNGEVTYGFDHVSDEKQVFSLNPKTGEVKVVGAIDYEKESSYEMQISGKDGLGLASYASVVIEIIDINDNAPVISLKSLTNPIPENVSPAYHCRLCISL